MDRFKPSTEKENAPLILFDGVCGLCSASMQWLIAHDSQAVFCFSPIQSRIGSVLYQQLRLDPKNIDTFVLIKGEKAYLKSNAALEIVKIMGGLWRAMTLFYIIPRPLRDGVYNLIAKNRLHFMGRHQNGMIPSDDMQNRFLE